MLNMIMLGLSCLINVWMLVVAWLQDCHVRSEVPYHFCYHKCQGCGSYNTRVMSRQEE